MRIARGLPMRPFETYDISMELVAAMGPVIAKVKRRDVDLSNQLKRAVTSIPLNLAEGAERRIASNITAWPLVVRQRLAAPSRSRCPGKS
jgi:23S rRNA-intervening sequence protein